MHFLSKVFFLGIFILFFSLKATEANENGDLPAGLTPEQYLQLRDKDQGNIDREFEYRKQQDADRRADEAARERQRQATERARQQKEELRELRDQAEQARERAEETREKAQDKCDEAHDKVQEEMEAKKEEKEKWEEKFYDLEEKITDLEKENSEKQVEINEKIDELKKEAQEAIQEMKDEMGEELKAIDEQVQELQESMAELNDELYKIEETRLTAFYARRKQQNEFYSNCFTKALEQTEKERSQFYGRVRKGNLKRKSVGQLMEGGKKQTKNAFSSRFNSFLQLCLNNQAALLKKQNEKDEYQLTLEKLDRQEDRAKQKIVGIKAQIQNMKTTGKVEAMDRFKEKMQARVNSFSQSYNSLTSSHQKTSQQVIQQIEKIKKQQAYVLSNRAQAVPQETRSVLMAQKCDKMDLFNLFPNPTSFTPPIILPTGGISFGTLQ